jgi:flagellar export protein FliJ
LEEISQLRLAAKIARLRNQEEEIQELTHKRNSYDEEVKKKSFQGIQADEYSLYKEFGKDSWEDLLTKESRKKEALREVEDEREKTITLSKEKKILEKLEEKKFRTFLSHLEKLEQKGNDEIVVMKYRPRFK